MFHAQFLNQENDLDEEVLSDLPTIRFNFEACSVIGALQHFVKGVLASVFDCKQKKDLVRRDIVQTIDGKLEQAKL